MPQLTVINNVFENEPLVVETDNVIESLQEMYGDALPDNARLYDTEVSEKTDITPNEADMQGGIQRLLTTENVVMVNYPGFFLFGLGLFKSLLGIFVLGLITYLLRPKPPEERNTADQSPNNGLSDRRNQARPNARIPDIYGTVRSTPDLISAPYKYFKKHREFEVAYMAIGRGEFNIGDVKDGETPVEDISGLQYTYFPPFSSPNSRLSRPVIEYGGQIQDFSGNPERVWAATKNNAVNGQVLRAPNAGSVDGDEDIAFNGPDQIAINNGDIDFEEYFAIGDVITISNSVSNGNNINLDGTYSILSLNSSTITLANPSSVNSNWTSGLNTPFTSAQLRSTSDKWVGPFTVEGAERVILNFIAPQGLYMLDQEQKQFSIGVNFTMEYWRVDSAGNEITQRYSHVTNLNGSSELQNERLDSAYFVLPDQTIEESYNNTWKIRIKRTTLKPIFTDRQVVDETRLDSLYGLGYVEQGHFGNVATVMVKTAATSGALSVKERKFNMQVTRKIIGRDNQYIDGSNPWGFTPDVVQVHDGTLIMRDIALDPHLGNMAEEQLDYQSMFTASALNQVYFGTIETRNFNHTFDDKNLSAEEMLIQVADAIHCVPYRQGNQFKLKFEGRTNQSILLFNHRNKIPDSELRTVKFGTNDDHDGVDFDWVDPDDGSIQTLQVPDDTGTNHKKVEMPGIQSELQAHFHAWRIWNKIKYRNIAVEFDCTAEAALLIRNDRILVADNTRSTTYDGHIVARSNLTLTLSQPIDATPGASYSMHLQHYDGKTELIPINIIPNNKQVVLTTPPRLPLVIDKDYYAQTTYTIVEENNPRALAFMVQEREPETNFQQKIRAHNYDDRFYERDNDFNDGLFDDPVSNTATIFRETWEDLDCPPGQWRYYQNPGLFTSNFPIEIQNNIADVGGAAQGAKHAEIDGSNHIWVDLDVSPVNDYRLLLYYSPRPNVAANDNAIEIWWNGSLFHTLIDTGGSDVDWRPIFLNLPRPTSIDARLEFRSINDPGDGRGGLIDDIRVQEISKGEDKGGIGESGWWCPTLDNAGYQDALAGSTDFSDLTDNGNTGTLTNMDPPTDWVINNEAGGEIALLFDGTNDYVKFSPITLGSDSFSISHWLKVNSTIGTSTSGTRTFDTRGTGGWGTVAGVQLKVYRSGTDVYFRGAIDAGTGTEQWRIGPGLDASPFIVAQTAEWFHMAHVIDRDNDIWRIYVNGVQVQSYDFGVKGISSITSALPLVMGGPSNEAGSQLYKGHLDDVRLYLDRVLTPSEISFLAQRRGVLA